MCLWSLVWTLTNTWAFPSKPSWLATWVTVFSPGLLAYSSCFRSSRGGPLSCGEGTPVAWPHMTTWVLIKWKPFCQTTFRLYVPSLLNQHGKKRKRNLYQGHSITVLFFEFSHIFRPVTQFSPIPLPKWISIATQLLCLHISFSYKTANYGLGRCLSM